MHWILVDVGGENVYTEDGRFAPISYANGDDVDCKVARFATEDEAERVQFVLQWAKNVIVHVRRN